MLGYEPLTVLKARVHAISIFTDYALRMEKQFWYIECGVDTDGFYFVQLFNSEGTYLCLFEHYMFNL